MYKTDLLLIKKCRNLRINGFTVREISSLIKLPTTTVYEHIFDIPISCKLKERLRIKQIKNAQKLVEFNIKTRKGKCIPGRIVIKPDGWANELIFLLAHFMFDGEIQVHSCIYNNRNVALIDRVKFLMKKVFNLQPYDWLNKKTGVYRISYHYVELADYVRKKAQELKKYIRTASLPEKKTFLKAFLMMKVAFILTKK